MKALVIGCGRVGSSIALQLDREGWEVTAVDEKEEALTRLGDHWKGGFVLGHATEIHVLERAGIARPPDVVAALTGDDEDNLVISQLAREKYGVPKVIARVNDPRNQAHFDLLGISPTVSATRGLMALIEHEVPEHDLVHLLELRKENLEIVEVQIAKGDPAAGKTVEKLRLPEGSRLISIMRNGRSEIAVGATELQPGGQLAFGPDGLLYLGLGDGGSGGDPENRAQNLRSKLGKLLRLNVNRGGARWRIAGYGLRNPWRFAFDRANGNLYIADVGQNEFEEIDFRSRARLARVANYGWSVYEGRARYDTSRRLRGTGQLVMPVAIYSHRFG